MPVIVKWDEKPLMARVKHLIQVRLRKVGHVMRAHIVRKIRKMSTRKFGPSKPGEPPHVDTGTLSGRHIFWRFAADDDMSIEIGTNVKYGAWLEMGTTKMAARPYLRPSLIEKFDQIQKILRSRS